MVRWRTRPISRQRAKRSIAAGRPVAGLVTATNALRLMQIVGLSVHGEEQPSAR